MLLCFKLVTPGAGPVLTPWVSFEQNWLRFIRRCYIPNIKALRLQVSEEKIFKVFLLCSYAQTCDPRGGARFDLRGHTLNRLGRGPLGDATYQISKLCTFLFQRRRFLKFSVFVPMFQYCDPRGGVIFDPRGII